MDLKEKKQTPKRKCVDYDKNNNNSKKKKILNNDVNEENNDIDENMNAASNTSSKKESSKIFSRTPKTKYGEDGIAIENFLSYVDRKNDVFFKKEELSKLSRIVARNKKALNDIQTLMKQDPDWFNWNKLTDSKADEDHFKTLTRIIAPNAKILGKDVVTKKNYFAVENITKIKLIAAIETTQKAIEEGICKMKHINDHLSQTTVYNDES